MTKEFKEQNAVEFDGKLICRHFLKGNCIKGEECQLEHGVPPQNNMLREACTFYIKGYCFSGASCPYMHGSIPCKYLHTRGYCFQGDECRFSHDPLTDLTQELLDQALKKDEEWKAAQSMNADQPAATDDAVTSDLPKPAVDILLNPVKLSFYNSSGPSQPDAEKSDPLWNEAVSPEVAEQETPHTDTTPALNRPPSPPGSKEPASYSINPFLGSHRPFVKTEPCSIFDRPVGRPSPGHSSRRSPDRAADRRGRAAEPLGPPHGRQDEPPCGLSAGAVATATGAQLTAPPGRSADGGDVTGSDEAVVGPSKPLEARYPKLFSGPLNRSSSPHRPLKRCSDPPHNPQGCKGPLSHPDESALGTRKPPNKSFLSIFAGPLCPDTAPKRLAQTKPRTPTTPPGPPEHLQLPCPPATDIKREVSRVVETVVSSKPLKTPFTSLFSGPIGENSAPRPPNPTIPDTRAMPSCHKDSTRTPGPPPPSPRESKVKPSKTPFHNLFAGLDDQSLAHTTPPTEKSPDPPPPTGSSGLKGEVPGSLGSHKPLDKPFCGLFAGPISEAAAPQPPAQTEPAPLTTKDKVKLEPTSDREPAKTSSVLKTLFLRLSPCRHEGEQEDSQDCKGCKDTGSDALVDKSTSTRGTAYAENQIKEEVEEDEGQTDDKKVPKGSDAGDEPTPIIVSAPRLPLSGPSPRRPLPGRLTLLAALSRHAPRHPGAAVPRPPPQGSVSQRAVGAPRPPLRSHVHGGFHSLPVRPLAPMTRAQPKPRVSPWQPRAQSVDGAATTLKDLFRTFDPTASPFGSQ